jgi:hypothetical protein
MGTTATPLMATDILNLLRIFLFHFILQSYLWVNPVYIRKLPTNKTKIITLTSVKRSASCRELSDKFNILSLANTYCHYIYMRYKHDLLLPNAKFNSHQQGVYYTGTKLNNALPPNITIGNYDTPIKMFKCKDLHTTPNDETEGEYRYSSSHL